MRIANVGADGQNGSTIAVVLLGEHSIFREGVRKLLENEPGISVVGDVTDARDVARMASAVRPVILIVGLSGRPLIRAMRLLHELAPSPQQHSGTIVVTNSIHKTDMFEALRLGAGGILLNETPTRVLFDTVRSVAAGDRWTACSRLTVAADVPQTTDAGDAAANTGLALTQRELEIVAAVRRGDSNRTIARQFAITESTVKHHLTRIFVKTGVVSRLELAVFAMKARLGDVPDQTASNVKPSTEVNA